MNDAPQHGATAPGPHPLPLFLDLVARTATHDPDLARAALAGLRVYRAAPRCSPRQRPVVDQQGHARLLGIRRGRTTVVLVPSLINGSAILDLSTELSLIDWLEQAGYDALLVDWGTPTLHHADMGIDQHVTQLLLPLLRRLCGPVHLIGYCLGGTIAAAAASHLPVQSLTLLATPWCFSRYPAPARTAMAQFWRDHRAMSESSGGLPIAWLQRLFWGLDPERTVAKYAALAIRAVDDPEVARFTLVEDWSNGGAPLTWAAARQLFEDMIDQDRPGNNQWMIGPQLIQPTLIPSPTLQIVAADDRIVPAETSAPALASQSIAGGHVGMIVGRHRFALRHAILRHIGSAM